LDLRQATKAASAYDESPAADHAMRLRDLILEISLESIAFTPPGRAETLARQFLSRRPPSEDDVEAAGLVGHALALAGDLSIFAPSSSGSTAIDRYLRARPPTGNDAVEAANALRRARFRIARIDACEATDIFQATDVATGERIALFENKAGPTFVGSILATRLCPLAGNGFIATGPAIPLDEDCLEIARGFFRPNGKGLTNGERCAEAIYRHVIRHCSVPAEILDALIAEMEEPDTFPFGPETSPISALAHRWAELPPGVEPSPADLATARGLTSADHLIDAIALAETADEYSLPGLSGAFARIAIIQIETMHRRASVGSGRASLDRVARLIDDAIRAGELSPGAQARFADLRRRARVADRGVQGDANLDRLLQVIQGLRAKTVDQGCTEAEALAAAAKVAELLDRYGLSLSDVDLRKQTCEGVGIETTRRRSGPIDHTVPYIAAFFDCRCWSEKREDQALRHIFFGLPADVEAARYLYELVEMTFETETLAFKNGDIYRDLHPGDRRSGTNSFQLGVGSGINTKLDKLRREREAALHRSSDRDLMIVKASIVDRELDKLGMAFTSRAVGGKKYVLSDAYAAGQEAGERFDYRPGIGQ
jgi:hypothetical protein